jgi:hypothetical protein
MSRARSPAGPRTVLSHRPPLRASGVALLALVLLAACMRYQEPDRFLARKGIDAPSEEGFTVCHGYDCTFRTRVLLTAAEWKQITAPLEQASPDAATERARIALAIAEFEIIVGGKTGTSGDRGKLQFLTAGDATQLDCIDETTNTTTYLMMLERRGKLRWHHTGRPASRGAFIDGRWHHETAVLVEIGNGAEFAIDSWFEDNGKPPHVVPLDSWSFSWSYS